MTSALKKKNSLLFKSNVQTNQPADAIFSEIKLDDSTCVLFKLTINSTLMVQVFLQSVPAWVGAWRRGWWGQGDSGRGLHWVIHG